ncbi:hypothetical protein ATN38_29610 [Rhodococcus sp. FH8]|nr:hypothetical protein G418_10941 [Rhodococcus qingshengii BKS 20-40]KDQ01487.1 hypothetical protein EN35_21530 [Rhodococcus qingshengii]MBW0283888.1 hypothetical protein [Rhodococcus sp. FH8]
MVGPAALADEAKKMHMYVASATEASPTPRPKFLLIDIMVYLNLVCECGNQSNRLSIAWRKMELPA